MGKNQHPYQMLQMDEVSAPWRQRRRARGAPCASMGVCTSHGSAQDLGSCVALRVQHGGKLRCLWTTKRIPKAYTLTPQRDDKRSRRKDGEREVSGRMGGRKLSGRTGAASKATGASALGPNARNGMTKAASNASALASQTQPTPDSERALRLFVPRRERVEGTRDSRVPRLREMPPIHTRRTNGRLAHPAARSAIEKPSPQHKAQEVHRSWQCAHAHPQENQASWARPCTSSRLFAHVYAHASSWIFRIRALERAHAPAECNGCRSPMRPSYTTTRLITRKAPAIAVTASVPPPHAAPPRRPSACDMRARARRRAEASNLRPNGSKDGHIPSGAHRSRADATTSRPHRRRPHRIATIQERTGGKQRGGTMGFELRHLRSRLRLGSGGGSPWLGSPAVAGLAVWPN